MKKHTKAILYAKSAIVDIDQELNRGAGDV